MILVRHLKVRTYHCCLHRLLPSKAALKLMTEGLYAELKETGVKVTIVHPGAMKTGIMDNSGLKSAVEVKSTKSDKTLSASEAAKKVIRAMEKDKFRAMVGKDARMLDILYRLNPRNAVDLIIKKMGFRVT